MLITDGYDENSESNFDVAIGKLKASGVTLYVIGVGGIAGVSLNGETLLKRLCERDRRTRMVPARRSTAGAGVPCASLARCTSSTCSTYTPRNQLRDGKWRSIDVKIPGTEISPRPQGLYGSDRASSARLARVHGSGSGQAPPSLTREDLTFSKTVFRSQSTSSRRLCCPSPSCWHSIRAAA